MDAASIVSHAMSSLNVTEYTERSLIYRENEANKRVEVCELEGKQMETGDLYNFFEIDLYSACRAVNAPHNRIDALPANSPKTLVALNLSYNSFASLDSCPELPNLTELNLSHNKLTCTYPLPLPNLKRLNLSSNKIEQIVCLDMYKLLEELDLSENLIEQLEDVRILSLNRHLKSLVLEGNPINNTKNFRSKARHLLPTLVTLNGQSQNGQTLSYSQLHAEKLKRSGSLSPKKPVIAKIHQPASKPMSNKPTNEAEDGSERSTLSLEVRNIPQPGAFSMRGSLGGQSLRKENRVRGRSISRHGVNGSGSEFDPELVRGLTRAAISIGEESGGKGQLRRAGSLYSSGALSSAISRLTFKSKLSTEGRPLPWAKSGEDPVSVMPDGWGPDSLRDPKLVRELEQARAIQRKQQKDAERTRRREQRKRLKEERDRIMKGETIQEIDEEQPSGTVGLRRSSESATATTKRGFGVYEAVLKSKNKAKLAGKQKRKAKGPNSIGRRGSNSIGGSDRAPQQNKTDNQKKPMKQERRYKTNLHQKALAKRRNQVPKPSDNHPDSGPPTPSSVKRDGWMASTSGTSSPARGLSRVQEDSYEYFGKKKVPEAVPVGSSDQVPVTSPISRTPQRRPFRTALSVESLKEKAASPLQTRVGGTDISRRSQIEVARRNSKTGSIPGSQNEGSCYQGDVTALDMHENLSPPTDDNQNSLINVLQYMIDQKRSSLKILSQQSRNVS